MRCHRNLSDEGHTILPIELSFDYPYLKGVLEVRQTIFFILFNAFGSFIFSELVFLLNFATMMLIPTLTETNFK